MAAHHYAEQLDSLVACMLSQGSHELFERNWKLYQESAYISEPDGFYFRGIQDATYRNIAVAGDNRIVDIEADETSDHLAGISISSYRAFSGVGLYIGSIPNLPRTQGSLLTVVCRGTSSASLGPYWSAHDEEEAGRLRDFAKILVKAVFRG